MAHFAKLGTGNIVEQVIVVNNEELLDENGIEQEQKGIDFCKLLFGEDTNWVQTSYNSSFRKNYAGIGFSYDQTKDVFIQPKPYDSWILNETTCNWETPIPMPQDGNFYEWNEETLSWDLINNQTEV